MGSLGEDMAALNNAARVVVNVQNPKGAFNATPDFSFPSCPDNILPQTESFGTLP